MITTIVTMRRQTGTTTATITKELLFSSVSEEQVVFVRVNPSLQALHVEADWHSMQN